MSEGRTAEPQYIGAFIILMIYGSNFISMIQISNKSDNQKEKQFVYNSALNRPAAPTAEVVERRSRWVIL